MTPRLEDERLRLPATYRQRGNALQPVTRLRTVLETAFGVGAGVLFTVAIPAHLFAGLLALVFVAIWLRQVAPYAGSAQVWARLDAQGLHIRLDYHRPIHYVSWEGLAYAYGGGGAYLTLYTNLGPLCYVHVRQRGSDDMAYHVVVGLAHKHLPRYRQLLAAGEAARFGAVVLWRDRLQVGEHGPVLAWEAVRYWRHDGETLTVHDEQGAVMATVALEGVLNPDLLWELLGEWGLSELQDGDNVSIRPEMMAYVLHTAP